MKEVKRQMQDLILSIAQGSDNPVTFNQNIRTLSKLSDTMIDHIDEIETELTSTKSLHETLTSDHEKLKKSYHEKWGSEDHSDEEDYDKGDEEKEITEEDVLNTLVELSTEGE